MRIENRGPEIVASDYWLSDRAQAGALFVSVNARAFRLLVPADLVARVREGIAGAQAVLVERGSVVGEAVTGDAYRLIFEDGTDRPFAVTVGPGSWDRLVPRGESGRPDLACLVYGPGAELLARLPARFVAVSEIALGAR